MSKDELWYERWTVKTDMLSSLYYISELEVTTQHMYLTVKIL